ncbi:MAG TPA: hypothetical protein VH280_01765 [Verrucomicrobiae bacterium]|jgi:hypothetical protein|nr:hypothetical protein [Verrucomicrobiae bacterium]
MNVQLDETRQDITIGGGTVNLDDDSSDGGPEQTVSVRSGGGRDVTLTLPNGRQATFAYNLVPGGEAFTEGLSCRDACQRWNRVVWQDSHSGGKFCSIRESIK